MTDCRSFVNESETLAELIKYKDRLSAALRSAGICVFEVDLERQVYTFFENAEAIFSVSGQEILDCVQQYSGLPPAEYRQAISDYFVHKDDQVLFSKALEQIQAGTPATYHARVRVGECRYVWCKIDETPVFRSGKPIGMIGVIDNISEMKAKTEELEEAVKLDDFTGLYTKTHSEQLIRTVLEREPHRRHALVLLDLDYFKKVNDSYGHLEGDRVLQLVAGSLKRLFRSTDTIGRFGGDEFMILLRDIRAPGDIHEKLNDLLAQRKNWRGVTTSAGAAFYPDDAQTFDELLDKADKALYRAKRTKNTYALFSGSLKADGV